MELGREETIWENRKNWLPVVAIDDALYMLYPDCWDCSTMDRLECRRGYVGLLDEDNMGGPLIGVVVPVTTYIMEWNGQ